VVRIIAKSHFDAHTDPIFKNLGILNFHDIHLLHLGLFMYSYQNQTLPSKFACKFTLKSQIHSYHTRNTHTFRLLFCRTNIKKFSVFYQGPKLYNSLNADIASIRPLQLRSRNHLRHLFVITTSNSSICVYFRLKLFL